MEIYHIHNVQLQKAYTGGNLYKRSIVMITDPYGATVRYLLYDFEISKGNPIEWYLKELCIDLRRIWKDAKEYNGYRLYLDTISSIVEKTAKGFEHIVSLNEEEALEGIKYVSESLDEFNKKIELLEQLLTVDEVMKYLENVMLGLIFLSPYIIRID